MREIDFKQVPDEERVFPTKTDLSRAVERMAMGESVVHTFDFEPNKAYAKIMSMRTGKTVFLERVEGTTFRVVCLGPRGKWHRRDEVKRRLLDKLDILSPAEALELSKLNRRYRALFAVHGPKFSQAA